MKNKSEKDLILDRLKRILGQIQGIEKMVIEDRACEHTIHQIMAVRNALSKVAAKLLAQESCAIKSNTVDLEKTLNNLFKFD